MPEADLGFRCNRASHAALAGKKSTPERLAHGRICDVPLIAERRIGSLEIVHRLSAGS